MRFFFGIKYASGNDFFRILSLGFMIHVLVGLSEVLLIAINKSRAILFCSVVSFTCNLVLNYLLIPVWGITGAAVSVLTTAAVSNILTSFFLYWYTKIHPFTRNYYKLVITNTCALLTLLIVQQTGWISLNAFIYLAFSILTVPLTLLLTRNFDLGDIMLLTLFEKKMTNKTTLSDKLMKKLKQQPS